jgi:anti-sigma B factor antagonist
VSELATLRTELEGTRFVVHIAGEIDISNAQDLEMRIERAVPKEVVVLMLDLSETKYLDSSGVALLLRMSERLSSRRIALRVVVPRDNPIRSVLELTGLSRLLALDEELAADVDAPD